MTFQRKPPSKNDRFRLAAGLMLLVTYFVFVFSIWPRITHHVVAHDDSKHGGPISRTIFTISLPMYFPFAPGEVLASAERRRIVLIDLVGPDGVRVDDHEPYALRVASDYPGLPPGDASLKLKTHPAVELVSHDGVRRKNGGPLEIYEHWDSVSSVINVRWGQEANESGRKQVNVLDLDIYIGRVDPADIRESERLRQSTVEYHPASGRVRGNFRYFINARPKDGLPVWAEVAMRFLESPLGVVLVLLALGLYAGVPLVRLLARLLGRG